MKFNCSVHFSLMFNTETTNDSREYPKSISDKMNKLYLHHNKVTCQVVYSTSTYFTIDAPSKECAAMMCGKKFNEFYKKENLKPFNVTYEIKEADIMDTLNAHDPKLVEHINYIWCRASERFKPILFALYERDKVEAEEKDIIVPTDDNFDSFAYDFLMHVCDDADLETILNFVRYREETANGCRTLYAEGWVNY